MDLLVPNADFSASSVGYALPAEDGLLGLFFLWDSLERASINLAGGPNLTVKGSPIIAPGGYFAACKGLADYFESLLYETGEMTAIACCWSPDAAAGGQPMYVGNFQGPAAPYTGANPPPNGGLASAGFGLFSSVSTNVRGLAARLVAAALPASDTADSPVTTLPEAPSAPAYYSFDAGAGGTKLKNWSTGTVVTNTTTNFTKPRLPNILPFRIGSGHATYNGLANVSQVALFRGRRTDAEIGANVAALRAELFAQKGVAVPLAA